VCTHVYMHVCLYVYVRIYVYMYVCMHMYVCMYVAQSQRKDRDTLSSFQERVQTQLQMELFKSARKILSAEQKVCMYVCMYVCMRMCI